MQINCESCGVTFIPTEIEQKKIKEAAEKGKTKLIMNCPSCGSMVMAQPIHLMGLSNEKPKSKDARLFCCPVSACIGFVEEDKDAKVFGCSECGTEWKKIEKVYSEIDKIIKKYPYRKEVYIKGGDVWKSILFDKIPKDYYNKVQKEKV